MSRAPIGIIGGYGAVGSAAARQLHAWGIGPLRIGGRRIDQAQRVVTEALDGFGTARAVDLDDPDELARFCAGCGVVVNCTGPSYRIGDRVAQAALSAGVDYIDVAGDDPVHAKLSGLDLGARGRTAVVSAGMMPGLSGLLPRILTTQGFDQPSRLTVYIGILDRFTLAGAADYIAGLDDGHTESLAAWRDGRKVSRVLGRRVDLDLPFFPAGITAHPYLNTEGERVARILSLDEADWYNVFDGQQVLAVLGKWQGKAGQRIDVAAAAIDLVRAAELDLAGRMPYLVYLFQLDGVADGRPVTRTMVLRAADAAALTGTATALTVAGLLGGEIPHGLHYAFEVLDPVAALDRLRDAPAIAGLSVTDGSIEEAVVVEEGAL